MPRRLPIASIGSAVRSAGSRAATASASRRSGWRDRGAPASIWSPIACSRPTSIPSRSPTARKRALLDDQVAQRDNPTQVAFRLFSEVLYGTHPYHRDALGTPDTVDALTASSLAAFYRARYPLSSLVLTIVGDVDVDDVVAHVTKRFTGAKSAKPDAPDVAAPVFDQRAAADREVYRFLDRQQARTSSSGFPVRRSALARSVRARAPRRRARRAERPLVRRASRQARAGLSRVGALRRGRRPGLRRDLPVVRAGQARGGTPSRGRRPSSSARAPAA